MDMTLRFNGRAACSIHRLGWMLVDTIDRFTDKCSSLRAAPGHCLISHTCSIDITGILSIKSGSGPAWIES